MELKMKTYTTLDAAAFAGITGNTAMDTNTTDTTTNNNTNNTNTNTTDTNTAGNTTDCTLWGVAICDTCSAETTAQIGSPAEPAEVEGKKIMPATAATGQETNANNHADDTTNRGVTQQFSNLPAEIVSQKRFFATDDKGFPPSGWSTPANQKLAAEVFGKRKFIGFDISGHGQGTDYALIDFDHMRNPVTGEFVCPAAEQWFNYVKLTFDGCYCELSQSGEGFHFLCRPTAGKFGMVTNKEGKGILYFDKATNAKVEIFYKNAARYCMLTGNLFDCAAGAPVADEVVSDEVLTNLLAAIAPTVQPTEEPEKPHAEISPDFQRLVESIKAITPAQLAAKGYLQRSEKGAPHPTGYICPWCGSGTHVHKTGALTFYETPNPHFACHACSSGGDVIKLLSKIYGIDNRGKDYFTLIRKAADDFCLSYEPTIFDFKPAPMEPKQLPAAENSLTEEQRAALYSGNFSDDEFARRLVFMYSDRIRYLANPADEWLIFKRTDLRGGVWQHAGEKNSVLYPLATELADKLVANARDKSERKFGTKLQEVKKKNSSITAIKGLRSVIVTPADLDTHDNLLNVQNGVVDLQTGKLYPAAPELLLTQQANAVYRQGFYSPIVDKFLADILPDEPTREALIRFLGYAATGSCCEEKALFCNGDGGNGKSTLIATLFVLLGDYAATLRTSAVLYAGREQDAGAATTELNPLENCRAAFIDELRQGGKLDTAKFKNLTGGEPIPIRKLHREQYTITPHFALILSGNYLPELSDTRDNGLLRRLMNITFDQSFIGDNRDPNLKAKLAADDALSGLLSRIVEAAVAWYRDGLLESAAMKQAREDYLAENDFIGAFISEYCDRGADLSIPRQDFLAKLKATCAGDCLKLFGNRDRALTDAVKRMEGITMRRGGQDGANKFFGIGWKATNRIDFGGEPIDPKDKPPF